jgi:hypothetical protein
MDTVKDGQSHKSWLLRIVSWSAAAGSFIAYAAHRGSPVVPPTSLLDGTFLWLSVGFLVLPFVRSLKIGKLVELEREVEKAKETVQEVRDDLRQMTSIVVTGFSATSTAQSTVIVQGAFPAIAPSKTPPELLPPAAEASVPAAEIRHLKTPPELSPPAAEPSLSAAEMKLLNTLWHFQVERYPNLNQRWTFRVDGPARDAAAFAQASVSLRRQKFIAEAPDGQVLLSDEGLRYCKVNACHFPADTWFFPPPLNRANEKHLMAKIDEL